MAGSHTHTEKFYGRRKGQTLSARQQRLLNDVLPKFRISLKEPAPGSVDPKSLFDFDPREIWLEIGFGKGEHLSLQASAHPDVGLIGCEPYINGVAGLVTKIHEKKLENVRIYPDDARHVLGALQAGSIDRVFLLHPDPWPKARHSKRRFVSHENLDTLAQIMKSGAELRVGTDHPIYMAWTMQVMQTRDDFTWVAEKADDWRVPPPDWPETRYAAKAKASSMPCAYFTFVKT